MIKWVAVRYPASKVTCFGTLTLVGFLMVARERRGGGGGAKEAGRAGEGYGAKENFLAGEVSM